MILIIIALFAAVVLGSCGTGRSAAEPVSADEFMLDTICSISIYRMQDESGNEKNAAEMEEDASIAMKDAFGMCRDLEDKLSRTRSDSDIGRINSARGEWVEVSEETLEVLELGMEYSSAADGEFDITCGGITGLWDFHAAEGEEKLPDSGELAEALKHINYRNIAIDGNRVKLADPDTEIDLGGIAKGYIGGKAAESLESSGVTSAIINLGGNVICIGGKSDSEDFTIGVETPYSDRSEIVGSIGARNKTLVTSGIYERKITVGGETYHHILDTGTGYPVRSDLLSATVIADRSMAADADALSTICLIKGSEEAMRMIESTDGVDAVFVLEDGTVRHTEGANFIKK